MTDRALDQTDRHMLLRMARLEDALADEIQFNPVPYGDPVAVGEVREASRIRANALRHVAGKIGLPPSKEPVAGVPVIPSPAEVRAAQSGRGGWTRDQLRKWGVRWPPPKGWRQDLERQYREQQRRQK